MSAPSVLTRHVFRSLVANRPYAFTECARRSRRLPPFPRSRIPVRRQQVRSIFGISFGASLRGLADAKNTPSNIEAALGCMVDLVRARRTQSKPPSIEDVSDAFRFLFRSHLESPRLFTRNEIYLATEAFKHLREHSQYLPDDAPEPVSNEDLQTALKSLASLKDKEKYRSDASGLARLLFEDLRNDANAQGELDSESSQARGAPLRTYIDILSSSGSARKARDLLLNSPEASDRQSMSMWISTIKGLFLEGLSKEAFAALREMETLIGLLDPESHEALVVFLAEGDSFDQMKDLYNRKLEGQSRPTVKCLVDVANFCIRRRMFDWGAPVFKSLIAERADPRVFDVVVVWLLAESNASKSVESALNEAESILGVTEYGLTMKTFNRILRFAYGFGGPQTAQQCLDAAQSRDLRPDTSTYLLQLDRQIEVGDLNAAKVTYEVLLSEDLPEDNIDMPVLNRFLAAICFFPKPEIDLVMRVVDGLLDRGADLEAETLAGLCHFFLQKDDLEEATGLLRYRADSYPASDRARIAEVFQQFINDPKIVDHRAFNAYELFRHAFPETPIEQRVVLMQSFFSRNRSDLACLVFGHMRQREDIEARPNAEAYAQCFEGIAQCRDVDGLQMIYNMLKLDLEVEQTTRIHNGMMAAYTACQMPYTSIIDHFWKIMDSREGPTLSSFALALRACETWVPQGADESRRIIALMQKWGFPINREIYHCYIGAIAGQSEFENTVELIEEMERDIGEPVDVITLGTFYNAIPWQFRKDEVESWAKQAYPHLWEELLTFGDVIDEEWEMRYFKIDRSINIHDEPLFWGGEYDPQIAKNSQVELEAPLK